MQNDRNVTTPFAEQRKLGAVMFADMTGYTAMMQEDEVARTFCIKIISIGFQIHFFQKSIVSRVTMKIFHKRIPL